MKVFSNTAICFLLVLCAQTVLAEEGHEEAGNPLQLGLQQREKAGIEVASVAVRELSETLRIPAEVVINAYRSTRVTPRIQAQVLKRQVQLGDHVVAGQALVTLSSVAMAAAQGDVIVTDREWQRVKSLGRKAIGERRYIEAQIARQQAFAKVLAFGMLEKQANELLKSGNAANAVGEFDLLSPLTGTILQDDFIHGELIEPGRVLFEVSDESVLWVEARVTPGTLSSVGIGAPARIKVSGSDWIDGTVVQLHHRLSETTRTQGVRIAVDNAVDLLHPGQFAEAEIVTGPGTPALAVPNESITLIKGAATVFKLTGGNQFVPEPVDTGEVVGAWTVIRAGLAPGDEIAVKGVFYIKSLLLKSSIGDEH